MAFQFINAMIAKINTGCFDPVEIDIVPHAKTIKLDTGFNGNLKGNYPAPISSSPLPCPRKCVQ